MERCQYVGWGLVEGVKGYEGEGRAGLIWGDLAKDVWYWAGRAGLKPAPTSDGG